MAAKEGDRNMALFEDDRPIRKPKHQLGEELATLSIDELTSRIGLLREEISRLEQAIAEKQASKLSAASFFKR